jgi:hypothetical protein
MTGQRTKPAADNSVLDWQLTQIGGLGVFAFESVEEVRRRQADLLERLESNAWFRHLGTKLQRCTAERCGGNRCVEVCAFADWRRRLQLIPPAYRLIDKADDPAYEVRVVRGIWARPIDELREVSIAAAKQLNRRVLDSLYIPSLVAVGTFKVAIGPTHLEPHWVCEIHQIVAGAKRKELDDAFTRTWGKEKYDSVVRVKKIKDLGRALNDVFKADLQGWQHPEWPDGTPVQTPKKHHREEFYRWLFSLSFGERMIRYGCDRYLNRLKKKPRVVRPKVYKPRPYPFWLRRFMFGNRGQPSEEPRRRDREDD